MCPAKSVASGIIFLQGYEIEHCCHRLEFAWVYRCFPLERKGGWGWEGGKQREKKETLGGWWETPQSTQQAGHQAGRVLLPGRAEQLALRSV